MLRRRFLGGVGTTAVTAAFGRVTAPLAAEGPAGPVVATRQGDVRGALIDGIHVFKGLPFAAPPAGANALKPPQPIAWNGVRDALTFGPKPPQTAYPSEVAALVPPEFTAAGDDCLTLNIWSADLGARQPVMVWVAGGMFEYHATGASPWYDGSRFARDGVVLVSINYRVGAAGFLHLGDGLSNLGLLDQLAALEWVRDNIAAFGGDPDRVTVFGESAGALSIGTLLSMPRAKGLFRRAIVESGGAQHVTSAATAERIGRHLAEKLGVEPSRDTIAALPVERLIEAQNALRLELAQPDPQFWGEVMLTGLPWAPVADGEIVPLSPIDSIRAGASADVDLMVGSNTEEWRLFLVPGGAIDQVSPQVLAGTIMAMGLQVETTLATYGMLHPGASPGDLLAAIMTDWYWRIPALRLAEAHAAAPAAAATYMYEFGWRSPQFGGRLGASHAIEIPFVFDRLDQAEPLIGAAPPQALADAMHGAWVAFAATGDPGWPGYELEARTTMHFDRESRLVDDPLAVERAFWEGRR